MKLNTIIISLFVVLLSLSLTACSGNEEDNFERINSPTDPDYSGTLQNEVERTDVFSFELKESFSSRKEVLREKERLSEAYSTYKNDCYDEKLLTKAFETLSELQDKLDKELEKFPPDEAEILEEKEMKLDYEVNYLELSLSTLYAVWQDDPDNQEKKQYYLDEKENLAFAQKIKQQYSDGKISIDQALEALETEY